MRNYVQTGDVVALTAPAALKSGDGFLVGAMFGVAVKDAASGESVDARVTGVIELPKAAVAIAQGVQLYWDDTAKAVTTASASNTLIGKATETAAIGGAFARVRLSN